ncbi:unnamed protein product [Trichogramma brassicae]|uniref:Uncharacterized protein n=1 Tax=Trichogramma brassicae TaxID=86971 RepID=A0A6H5I9I3_9HYME|nr:unnamed protein product [Trichogramma brassicae]
MRIKRGLLLGRRQSDFSDQRIREAQDPFDRQIFETFELFDRIKMPTGAPAMVTRQSKSSIRCCSLVSQRRENIRTARTRGRAEAKRTRGSPKNACVKSRTQQSVVGRAHESKSSTHVTRRYRSDRIEAK